MSKQTSSEDRSLVPEPSVGRPPTKPEILEACRKMLEAGADVAAVKTATNLGLTKIYEVRRAMKSNRASEGAA